jgi:hypothetical protein
MMRPEIRQLASDAYGAGRPTVSSENKLKLRQGASSPKGFIELNGVESLVSGGNRRVGGAGGRRQEDIRNVSEEGEEHGPAEGGWDVAASEDSGSDEEYSSGEDITDSENVEYPVNDSEAVSSAKYFGEVAREDFFEELKLISAERLRRGYQIGNEGPEDGRILSPRSAYINDVVRSNQMPLPVIVRTSKTDANFSLQGRGLGDKKALPFAECFNGLPNVDGIELNLSDNRLTNITLLPLFKSLSAHDQCAAGGIKSLNLSKNHMDLKTAQNMAGYITNFRCRLESLTIQHAGIGDGEASVLLHAIAENTSITNLDLSHNLIGAPQGPLDWEQSSEEPATGDATTGDAPTTPKAARPQMGAVGSMALCFALEQNATLRRLNCSWNHISKGAAKALGRALAGGKNSMPMLQELRLTHNGFGDEGSQEVGWALRTNAELKLLDLSHNGVSAKGMVVIAGALKRRRGAELRVKLHGHSFSRQSGHALLQVLSSAAITHTTVECHGCLFQEENSSDAESADAFDIAEPSGEYTLDLDEPYGRTVLEELVDLAETRPSCKFDGPIIHRIPAPNAKARVPPVNYFMTKNEQLECDTKGKFDKEWWDKRREKMKMQVEKVFEKRKNNSGMLTDSGLFESLTKELKITTVDKMTCRQIVIEHTEARKRRKKVKTKFRGALNKFTSIKSMLGAGMLSKLNLADKSKLLGKPSAQKNAPLQKQLSSTAGVLSAKSGPASVRPKAQSVKGVRRGSISLESLSAIFKQEFVDEAMFLLERQLDARSLESSTGKPLSGKPLKDICAKRGTVTCNFFDARWCPSRGEMPHPVLFERLRHRLHDQHAKVQQKARALAKDADEVTEGIVEDADTTLSHIRQIDSALCKIMHIVPPMPHAVSHAGLVLDANDADALFKGLPKKVTAYERVETVASLVLAMIEPTEAVAFVQRTLPLPKERLMLKLQMGRLYGLAFDMPTGHYRLELWAASTRFLAMRLCQRNNYEKHLMKADQKAWLPDEPGSIGNPGGKKGGKGKEGKKGKHDGPPHMDTSQHGNGENFRNAVYNNTSIVLADEFFQHLPTSGLLELDYVSTIRPPHNAGEHARRESIGIAGEWSEREGREPATDFECASLLEEIVPGYTTPSCPLYTVIQVRTPHQRSGSFFGRNDSRAPKLAEGAEGAAGAAGAAAAAAAAAARDPCSMSEGAAAAAHTRPTSATDGGIVGVDKRAHTESLAASTLGAGGQRRQSRTESKFGHEEEQVATRRTIPSQAKLRWGQLFVAKRFKRVMHGEREAHDYTARIVLKKLGDELHAKAKKRQAQSSPTKTKKKGKDEKDKGESGKGDEGKGDEKDGKKNRGGGSGDHDHMQSSDFRQKHLHCTHDTLEQIECLVGGAMGRGDHGPPEKVMKEVHNRMVLTALKTGMLREHREVRLKLAKEHRFRKAHLTPESAQVCLGPHMPPTHAAHACRPTPEAQRRTRAVTARKLPPFLLSVLLPNSHPSLLFVLLPNSHPSLLSVLLLAPSTAHYALRHGEACALPARNTAADKMDFVPASEAYYLRFS